MYRNQVSGLVVQFYAKCSISSHSMCCDSAVTLRWYYYRYFLQATPFLITNIKSFLASSKLKSATETVLLTLLEKLKLGRSNSRAKSPCINSHSDWLTYFNEKREEWKAGLAASRSGLVLITLVTFFSYAFLMVCMCYRWSVSVCFLLSWIATSLGCI